MHNPIPPLYICIHLESLVELKRRQNQLTAPDCIEDNYRNKSPSKLEPSAGDSWKRDMEEGIIKEDN